jgi:hypothetical protein
MCEHLMLYIQMEYSTLGRPATAVSPRRELNFCIPWTVLCGHSVGLPYQKSYTKLNEIYTVLFYFSLVLNRTPSRHRIRILVDYAGTF